MNVVQIRRVAMNFTGTFLILSLSFALLSPSAQGQGALVQFLGSNEQKEQLDRTVDRAALDSQHMALKKIRKLIARNRGTSRESMLLAREAEILSQKAAIHFQLLRLY